MQRELAALDRMRREWIAGKAKSLPSQTWTISAENLVNLTDWEDHLPDVLPVDTDIPTELDDLAAANVLPVLSAKNRPLAKTDPPARGTYNEDSIVFRRPRSAVFGVYQRESAIAPWKRVRHLTADLDVVDSYSPQDKVSFDGNWLHNRKIDLAFHPDGSIKTYGVTAASTLSGIATAAGSALDAVGAAHKERTSKPDATEQALADAKIKLDLLKTSSEYAQLSAVHERAAELAELEQRVKLAELQRKLV